MIVIAGPCSIESQEMTYLIAEKLRKILSKAQAPRPQQTNDAFFYDASKVLPEKQKGFLRTYVILLNTVITRSLRQSNPL